jgi:hypothetical protein
MKKVCGPWPTVHQQSRVTVKIPDNQSVDFGLLTVDFYFITNDAGHINQLLMPASNYAAVRHRIINLCFTSRTKKYWTIEEVLEKLEENDISISRRTLERDLEVLRHDDRLKYYAPIAYDRSRSAFYYEDPTYSTSSVQLTGEDLLILREGQSLLQGVLELKEFTDTLQKVITQVGAGRLGGRGDGKGEMLVESFRGCGEGLIKLVRGEIGNL